METQLRGVMKSSFSDGCRCPESSVRSPVAPLFLSVQKNTCWRAVFRHRTKHADTKDDCELRIQYTTGPAWSYGAARSYGFPIVAWECYVTRMARILLADPLNPQQGTGFWPNRLFGSLIVLKM